jgi:hypothetical protein
MIVNENEEVFTCLPEFDLEIRTKRSTQASGKSWTENKSVILFFFFTGLILLRSLFFSLFRAVIAQFLRIVLELQLFQFDDEDSNSNLWELQ